MSDDPLRWGIRALAPSDQQRDFWQWHRLAADAATYNTAIVFSVRGPLDPARLRLAVESTVNRTPMLRASFRPSRHWSPAILLHDKTEAVEVAMLDAVDVNDVVRQPFDVSRPPILRLGMVSRGRDLHDVLLVSHHLVLDGTGLMELFRDLLRELNGYPADAREDYAAYVGRQICNAAEVGDGGADYVQQLLSNDRPAPLRLPGLIDGRGKPYATEVLSVSLSDDLTELIRVLSVTQAISPFMAVATAFATAVRSRYGIDRFVIGMPVDCRDRPGMALGTYTSVVPLALSIGTANYVDALRHVRSRILDLMEQVGRAPAVLADLLAEVTDGTASWHVLINGLYLGPGLTIGSHRLESVTPISSGAKAELAINVITGAAETRLMVTFSPDHISADEVAALVDNLVSDLYLLVQPAAPGADIDQFTGLDLETSRDLWDAIWQSPVDGKNVILRHGSHRFTDDEIAAYRDRVANLVRPFITGTPAAVIELGCGAGQLVEKLAGECGRYVATDPSRAAVEVVTQKAAALALPVDVRTAYAHEAVDSVVGPFDVVLLAGVVQFFPNRAYLTRVLTGAARLLRSGGAVVIADVVPPDCEQFPGTLKLAPADFDAVSHLFESVDVRSRPAEIGENLRYRYDVVLHRSRRLVEAAGTRLSDAGSAPAGTAPSGPLNGAYQRHPASSDLVTLIGAAFGDVLGRAIGPDDDFFAYGGSSVLLAAAVAAIRTGSGLAVQLRDFIGESTTPRAVAGNVQRALRVRSSL